MKKRLPLLLFLCTIAIISILFYHSRRSEPALRQAQKHESTGNMEKASALYGQAVYDLAPAITIPDINRSKFITSAILKKEVEKYFETLTSQNSSAKRDLTAAFSGLLRCMEYLKSPVTATKPKTTLFTRDSFYQEWNNSFFASKAKVDPSHRSLANGNFSRNLSLLLLTCGKNYSYECMLVNATSMQATTCRVPAENSTRLYALPGKYFLLVRSTVTFSNGDLWKSAITAFPVTVPDASSKITTKLRTRVHRNRK